jgi:hypothetical protein
MDLTDEPRCVELTENHRRPVAAMLRLLESACASMESWLDRESGPLLRVADDLLPEQRQSLRAKLTEVRAAVRTAARQLRLPAQQQSRRAAIIALLSANCCGLEDTMSHNLQGYGALAAEAAQHLDAHLHYLLGLLEDMRAIAERAPAEEKP